ncbi:MAG: hypothetical protein ACD_39C01576G0001 [uncultured bacterium]|nr:MAG: hypothetical protein ACD_39C01576G0001 [uncultured bacterium]
MKISKLCFKNINSLAGSWEIDFTAPAYLDGIFVITGQTGAGKSSILDAMCLALYGCTPRLGSIAQSSNEVMSRQTGECSAEITFSTKSGTYISSWEQHCAHKKAGGKLSPVKRVLADAESGKIIASAQKQVDREIIEITGMDFERFTRSMLLAQGGFAAFLQAKPDDRSPILEQITGTRIYSEISMHVHERTGMENEKLDLLMAETSGISLLGEDELRQIQDEISLKTSLEKDLGEKLVKTGSALQWLIGLRSLESDVQKLEAELVQALDAIAAFDSNRQRLHKALLASEFDVDYNALTSLRNSYQQTLKAIADVEKQIPARQHELAAAEKTLADAEQALFKLKEALKAEQGLIRQVRELDAKTGERVKACEKLKLELAVVEDKVAAENLRQKKIARDLAENSQKLEKIRQYLEDNRADAGLVGEFVAIKEMLVSLVALEKKHSQSQELVKNAAEKHEQEVKKLSESEKELQMYEKALETAVKSVEEQNRAIGNLLGENLLREYRKEQAAAARELALLQKIAGLEEERHKLEDGKPCVLCGSTDHPYARGNTPQADAAEEKLEKLTALIEQVEKLEDSLKEKVAEEKNAQKAFSEAEKHFESAKHMLVEAVTARETADAELAETQKHLQTQNTTALSRLAAFGITEITEGMPGILNARLKSWQEAQQNLAAFEKNTAELLAVLKGCEDLLSKLTEDLELRTRACNEEAVAVSALASARKDLYGDKDADAEELKFEKSVAEGEAMVADLMGKKQQSALQLNKAVAQQGSLKESSDALKLQLVTAECNFAASLKNRGFADEEQFLICRLERSERDALHRQAQELDNSKIEITAKLADARDRLQLEALKQLTDQPAVELQKQHDEIAASARQLGQELGALKQRLVENDRARIKFREKSAQIETQKAEFWRWSELNTLIGSFDGKKFRNMAQGLTFAVMIGHANRQLREMNDRYQLVRDPLNPLDLNVIDNYQAGEQRSIKNLSGGESFIVSLALALGLSSMASRNVRVDSLFLDEGFGTLDEDALESAVEALTGLHQEGRLIGIISHVVALKERISTRITVETKAGGRSIIEGPGCRRV